MAQNVSTPDIGMTKSQRKEVSSDFRGYFVQQRRKSLTNCDHSSATTSPVHHNNLPGICYRYHPHSGVGVGGSGGQNWMKKGEITILDPYFYTINCSTHNCCHSSATTTPAHHKNLPGKCYQYHPHSEVEVGECGGRTKQKTR